MSWGGLPGVLADKGTLVKYRKERGNIILFLGNRGTRLYKLKDENMVNTFIKRGTNKENVWEYESIGQFWKGTRTPLRAPPFFRSGWRDRSSCKYGGDITRVAKQHFTTSASSV